MLNSKLRSCLPKKRVPATMQDSQDDHAFLVTLHEVDDSVGEALDQSAAGLALKNWESFRSLPDLQQLLANDGQKAKAQTRTLLGIPSRSVAEIVSRLWAYQNPH